MVKHRKIAFENERTKTDYPLQLIKKVMVPLSAHQKVMTHPHILPPPPPVEIMNDPLQLCSADTPLGSVVIPSIFTDFICFMELFSKCPIGALLVGSTEQVQIEVIVFTSLGVDHYTQFTLIPAHTIFRYKTCGVPG